jgi:sulfotransferase
MEKAYHFLGGLPRSGNTLLAALLNQHPDAYASPLSPAADFLFYFDQQVCFNENSLRTPEIASRIDLFTKSFFDSFYKDIKKPIIIDRHKLWGNPDLIALLKLYVTKNPKIIITVRDIPEILASFISLDEDYYKDIVFKSNTLSINYRPFTDAVCDFIMTPGGPMDAALLSVSSCLKPEYKQHIHIVEYKDLMKNPQSTMNKVYEFLELTPFENTFTNIQKVEVDYEERAGHIKDLHKVRSELSPSTINPEKVLTSYSLNRYANMEFWRTESDS